MFSFLEHLKVTKKIHTVDSKETIWNCLELMEKNKIGAVLVVNKGKVVGIYTERDLLLNWRNMSTMAIKEIPIEQVMTKNVQTLSAGKLQKASVIMLAKKFRHLPILDEDKIVNILSIRDVLEMLVNENEHLKQEISELKKK